MKPSAFEYLVPLTIDDALADLTRHGHDGKVLAGGQSLIPLLNFRMARPEVLIDVNRIPDLVGIRHARDVLRIGALTRYADVERSPLVAERVPLLIEALRFVAHSQIRNRGTIGGSVAHADPAAEMPVVLTALGARFHARSQRGARLIPAEEMFLGPLQSALEPDELLTEIEIPAVATGSGWAFTEYARRHGDYGLGGAAVTLAPDREGAVRAASIVLLGAGPTPVRATAAQDVVAGRRIDAALAAQASRAGTADLRPAGDAHGDSDYRRELIATLVERALLVAWARIA